MADDREELSGNQLISAIESPKSPLAAASIAVSIFERAVSGRPTLRLAIAAEHCIGRRDNHHLP